MKAFEGDRPGRERRRTGRSDREESVRRNPADLDSPPSPEEEWRIEPDLSSSSGGEDLCFGRRAVFDLLKGSPERCLKVFYTASVLSSVRGRLLELCRERRVPVSVVTPPFLDRMAEGGSHQGMAARIAAAPLLEIEEAAALLPPEPLPALMVLLDHVQDPMNLGAVARSAEASGALCLLFPRRRGALPTGSVLKASAGAAARLPLACVGNVAGTIRRLQQSGLWAVGLDMEAATPLWGTSMPDRMLLVVGSEGEGLSKPVRDACDEMVRVPMMGAVGSLNASVAAALGMFEWVRRRLSGGSGRAAAAGDPSSGGMHS
jgi:23S rRNA (guanosine2251-2'-O)-methyltransferase